MAQPSKVALVSVRPNRADDAEDVASEPKDDGRRILEVQKNNAGAWGQRYGLRLVADGAIGLDGGDDSVVASIRRGTDRRWLLQAIGEAQDTGDPIHASERANRANLHKRLSVFDDYPAAFRGRRGTRSLFALAIRAKADRLLEEVQ